MFTAATSIMTTALDESSSNGQKQELPGLAMRTVSDSPKREHDENDHEDGTVKESEGNMQLDQQAQQPTPTQSTGNEEKHEPTTSSLSTGSSFRIQLHPKSTKTAASSNARKRKRNKAGAVTVATGFEVDDDKDDEDDKKSPTLGMTLSDESLPSSATATEDEDAKNSQNSDCSNDNHDAPSVVTARTDDVINTAAESRPHKEPNSKTAVTESKKAGGRNDGSFNHSNQNTSQEGGKTLTSTTTTNHHHSTSQPGQPEGWRVKLYRLNADGSWDDCGTGRILCLYKPNGSNLSDDNNIDSSEDGDAWLYRELGEPTLCMHSELSNVQQPSKNHQHSTTGSAIHTPRILLRTRILLREAYQRQGENIITWCEPYLEEGNPAPGVDLALSFQDNVGCLDIWKQVTQVQARAHELIRQANRSGRILGTGSNSNNNSDSVAPGRHNQQEVWANVASENQNRQTMAGSSNNRWDQFDDSVIHPYQDSNPDNVLSNAPKLPNPPTLNNLGQIADTIASVQHVQPHLQPRESLVSFIAQDDCTYLKSLLALFPSAEDRGDYRSLATLAACVKTILLLNDPSIIELIVNDELIFEDVCSSLEYDPDLRDKANHRWFLRERVKFRTVALMKDEELIAAIHRSFRVNFLRDTLLRPTMDESSLSTLSSLQTFTHADVVKGVTMSQSDDRGELLKDSYLAKVIRILGRESDAICEMEWCDLESLQPGEDVQNILLKRQEEADPDPSTIVVSGKYPQSENMVTIWKQHLAPQDDSMQSRRLRRRGSLLFLRELFNMVRVSLQQTDKDDFFAVLVSMEVDLLYDHKVASRAIDPRTSGKEKHPTSGSNTTVSSEPVNLLSLLANVLSNPETDVAEKGSVLEIVAGIAMHDPSLIRRRCLDFYTTYDPSSQIGPDKPRANEKNQVIFHCPPDDLMASLLFLLATESDAGLLLQASEIMRIILDTDMMGDHAPINIGFADESESIPPGAGLNPLHDQHPTPTGSGITNSTEQKKFLLMFYDHYVQWLVAPFQHTILFPLLRAPKPVLMGKSISPVRERMGEIFIKGEVDNEPLLHLVTFSALRCSFAVELLSFCVRAHVYRMKTYLLRSTVFAKVLKLLRPSSLPRNTSGDRCLKLASLRFLRAILSVKDDFYHRHIIQHDLFAPVFEAFRANPVGDNLVSSSIVEMCDYINSENIMSLIEYIVTKHLFAAGREAPMPSLEVVSSPYVSTLTALRKAYEKLLREKGYQDQSLESVGCSVVEGGSYHGHVVLNEKALEDQRKFREADHEESYFESDD